MAAPGWLSRVKPATAGRILTLTVIGAMAADPVVDPDSFWHVATGKFIARTRSIPKTDPFSWTAPGRKWIAHEWLIETVFAGLHALGGWPALVLYAIVTITASWAVVGRTCRRLGATNGVANVVTVIAAVSCLNTWGARPQMLSMFFGALFADLMVAAWQGRPKVLWWCVPITLMWCNAHGGYMFGLSMLVLFACGVVAEHVVRRVLPGLRSEASTPDRSLLVTSWLALVASLAISLVNPNGVEGFLYPFSYLGDNASTRYIEEWFAPVIGKAQWWPFFGLLAVAVLVCWAGRRRLPIYAVGGMVIYGTLGVQSVRNITQFSFFAAPFVASSLSRGLAAVRARSAQPTRNADAAALRTVLPVAGVLSALGIALTSLSGLTPSANASAQAAEFPVAATTYLRAHPTMNLYNKYDWGGYLILNAKQPVGIDGRPDMYGDAFVDRYVATWNLRDGWEKDLDRATVKSILAKVDEPITAKLRTQSNRWKVAYEDRQAVLFVRK